MTVFHGGTEVQIKLQKGCEHDWHNIHTDEISRYFKCRMCYCLRRDFIGEIDPSPRDKEELDSLEVEEGNRQWIGRCFKMITPSMNRVASYYRIDKFDADNTNHYGLLIECIHDGSIKFYPEAVMSPYWVAAQATELLPVEFTLEVESLFKIDNTKPNKACKSSLPETDRAGYWIGHCFKSTRMAESQKVNSYYRVNNITDGWYYGLMFEHWTDYGFTSINPEALMEPYYLVMRAQELSPADFDIEIEPLLDQVLPQALLNRRGGK